MYRSILFIVTVFLGGGVIYWAVNYSLYFPSGKLLQSETNGWTTPVASTRKEVMTPEWCRVITSSRSSVWFVPTRTLAWWVSFRDHLPSGVSISSCVVAVNWSCGWAANTCGAGSTTGYSAGSCGGSQTWSCLGSGGGTKSDCSIANAACPPVPVNCSYTTTWWGACSATCGGGTQSYYYTITAVAQHGWSCPVSEWQVVASQSCNTQTCPINGDCWYTALTCDYWTMQVPWCVSTSTVAWQCIWDNGWSNAYCEAPADCIR
jgi:hypothetical protein